MRLKPAAVACLALPLVIFFLSRGRVVMLDAEPPAPARRRVRLVKGEAYRWTWEFEKLSDSELSEVIASQPRLHVASREGDRATVVRDSDADEDGELDVPTSWIGIAALGFVADPNTPALWRVVDVRKPE